MGDQDGLPGFDMAYPWLLGASGGMNQWMETLLIFQTNKYTFKELKRSMLGMGVGRLSIFYLCCETQSLSPAPCPGHNCIALQSLASTWVWPMGGICRRRAVWRKVKLGFVCEQAPLCLRPGLHRGHSLQTSPPQGPAPMGRN